MIEVQLLFLYLIYAMNRDFCKELASEAIAEELAEKCRLEKQKQNEERKRRAFAIQVSFGCQFPHLHLT